MTDSKDIERECTITERVLAFNLRFLEIEAIESKI